VFEGYFRMHHAVLSSDTRTNALAELVLCTVNTAELAGSFVAIHAAAARRRGVTDAQLVEAVLCAVPVAGVAAWALGSAAVFPDV
jgi:AhpD family alkylhydroperoxidase